MTGPHRASLPGLQGNVRAVLARMLSVTAMALPCVAPSLLGGCGCTPKPEPPGYHGPLPSDEAQSLLGELMGRPLAVEAGATASGEWTVVAFGVIPNPVSAAGKGPVVLLQRGDERRHLPVEADGDVADLCRRVCGKAPPYLEGPMSEAYRAAMGL